MNYKIMSEDRGLENKELRIYRWAEGEVVFDMDAKTETIWATQEQISQLFGVDRTVVGRHFRNIFKDGELEEERVCAKNARTASDGKTYQVKMYNLDAIISVGYRVNSKKATNFRIWATKTLKKYIVDGVAVNERRLKELPTDKLEKVENVMKMVSRLVAKTELSAGEANGVLEVITRYTKSFQAIGEYGEGKVVFVKKGKVRKELTVGDCRKFAEDLRMSLGERKGFGEEREYGGRGLGEIILEMEKKETAIERAAELLYLVVKWKPFRDGNKRIGALLFVVYLTMNDCQLAENGETKISDRALTALVLLIAEGEEEERELITALVCKLLEG